MAIEEELRAELARRFEAARDEWINRTVKYHVVIYKIPGTDVADMFLADPALIKRMAEAVGFKVEEKPKRYKVERTVWCGVSVVWEVRDPQMVGRNRGLVGCYSEDACADARERAEKLAAELNEKEQG